MTRVRMTHPNLPGQEIYVPAQAVDGNRRTGWQTDEDVERAAAASADSVESAAGAPVTGTPAAPTRRITSPSGKDKE